MPEDFIINGCLIILVMKKIALTATVLEELKEMGYTLRERYSIGSVNAIQILPDGKIAGWGRQKRK